MDAVEKMRQGRMNAWAWLRACHQVALCAEPLGSLRALCLLQIALNK